MPPKGVAIEQPKRAFIKLLPNATLGSYEVEARVVFGSVGKTASMVLRNGRALGKLNVRVSAIYAAIFMPAVFIEVVMLVVCSNSRPSRKPEICTTTPVRVRRRFSLGYVPVLRISNETLGLAICRPKGDANVPVGVLSDSVQKVEARNGTMLQGLGTSKTESVEVSAKLAEIEIMLPAVCFDEVTGSNGLGVDFLVHMEHDFFSLDAYVGFHEKIAHESSKRVPVPIVRYLVAELLVLPGLRRCDPVHVVLPTNDASVIAKPTKVLVGKVGC